VQLGLSLRGLSKQSDRTSGPKRKEDGKNGVLKAFAAYTRTGKSKRIGWTGHVARRSAREEINMQVRKPERRAH
jgi:hypothetical protein